MSFKSFVRKRQQERDAVAPALNGDDFHSVLPQSPPPPLPPPSPSPTQATQPPQSLLPLPPPPPPPLLPPPTQSTQPSESSPPAVAAHETTDEWRVTARDDATRATPPPSQTLPPPTTPAAAAAAAQETTDERRGFARDDATRAPAVAELEPRTWLGERSSTRFAGAAAQDALLNPTPPQSARPSRVPSREPSARRSGDEGGGDDEDEAEDERDAFVFVVSGKKGALLRAGIELNSPVVAVHHPASCTPRKKLPIRPTRPGPLSLSSSSSS